MDKRIAQNALNFFYSDRFTFKGTDFLPLVEVVRELQAIAGEPKGNPPSGDTQD